MDRVQTKVSYLRDQDRLSWRRYPPIARHTTNHAPTANGKPLRVKYLGYFEPATRRPATGPNPLYDDHWIRKTVKDDAAHFIRMAPLPVAAAEAAASLVPDAAPSSSDPPGTAARRLREHYAAPSSTTRAPRSTLPLMGTWQARRSMLDDDFPLLRYQPVDL